jgi:formylglycine-generating enzyme required for sulfatase activity
MNVKWQSRNVARLWHPREWGALLLCASMFLFASAVWAVNSPDLVLILDETFTMGNSFTNLYPNEGWDSELPLHEVPVGSFYVGKFELTNEEMAETLQWAYTNGLVELGHTVVTNIGVGYTNIVTNLNGMVRNTEGISYELLDLDSEYPQVLFTNGAFTTQAGKTNFPCIEVTWYGALAFCNYLSDREGFTRAVDFSVTNWEVNIFADGYRLPTEAEWEKACRGGAASTHYPWPDDSVQGTNLYLYSIDPRKANYEDARYGSFANNPKHPWSGEPVRSTPVGYYDGSQVIANWTNNISYQGVDYGVVEDMANGYGLYDTGGNVYEWCIDWLGTNWYAQQEATLPDPIGPAVEQSFHSQRVARGGGWTYYLGAMLPDPSFQRCSFRVSFPPVYAASYLGFRVARRFQLAEAWTAGDQFTMTYGGVSGDVYIVESATDLTEASPWTPVAQVTNSGTGTEEIQLDFDGDKRLYRLNAVP